MTTTLAPNISYCVAGGRLILMDARWGRFFALPTHYEALFVAAIPKPSGPAPALDARLEAYLVSRGLVRSGIGPARLDAPTACPREVDFPTAHVASASVALVASACIEQVAVSLHLRLGSLAHTLAWLERRRRAVTPVMADRAALASLSAALQRSNALIAPAERCLVRSIAFIGLGLRRKAVCQLVIGVRSNPFRAHAWVQSGTHIVHDDLDQAGLFTPIFVS